MSSKVIEFSLASAFVAAIILSSVSGLSAYILQRYTFLYEKEADSILASLGELLSHPQVSYNLTLHLTIPQGISIAYTDGLMTARYPGGKVTKLIQAPEGIFNISSSGIYRIMLSASYLMVVKVG